MTDKVSGNREESVAEKESQSLVKSRLQQLEVMMYEVLRQ